ncbi:hypothetical protein WME89_05170 [Sorangium sp. So ce321]|uniref:hypothetical protein n=1 Tax=Sorangium sp. So ce321 TaxID=3133300 RepID=UPI003F5F6F43
MYFSNRMAFIGLIAEDQFVHYAEVEEYAPQACSSGTLVSCAVLVVRYVEERANLVRVLFAHLGGSYLNDQIREQLSLISEIADYRRFKVVFCHNYDTNSNNRAACEEVRGILRQDPEVIPSAMNVIYMTSNAFLIPEGAAAQKSMVMHLD